MFFLCVAAVRCRYMAEKFDTTEVAEAKNSIVAIEDTERDQTLESEIPTWLRPGAIVEARVLSDDHAICCSSARLPRPGVPFAVKTTATSVTIEWSTDPFTETLSGCPAVECVRSMVVVVVVVSRL